MKRRGQNLLLVAGSVALFLGLAEAVLWLVAPPPRLAPIAPGSFAVAPWGLGLTPGFTGWTDNRIEYRDRVFHVDARGRRVTPAARSIAVPRRRVWVLGDSQTFGQGLADAETWPNVLQRRLLAAGPADVRVENLGVPAINVDQYHSRLKATLPATRPGDLVLVGLSWNDLVTDQARDVVVQLAGGHLVTGAAGAAVPATQTAPSWRLRLFEATGVAIPRFLDVGQFVLDLSRNSALGSLLAPRLRTLYYRVRADSNAFAPLFAAGVARRNFQLLADMKRRAAGAGLGFAVVFLPNRLFFDDDLYAAYSQDGRAFPARNYLAHAALPLCRDFAIRCIDTFDALHARWRDRPAWPVDGHYAPLGARLVGETAAAAVLPLLAGPGVAPHRGTPSKQRFDGNPAVPPPQGGRGPAAPR